MCTARSCIKITLAVSQRVHDGKKVTEISEKNEAVSTIGRLHTHLRLDSAILHGFQQLGQEPWVISERDVNWLLRSLSCAQLHFGMAWLESLDLPCTRPRWLIKRETSAVHKTPFDADDFLGRPVEPLLPLDSHIQPSSIKFGVPYRPCSRA